MRTARHHRPPSARTRRGGTAARRGALAVAAVLALASCSAEPEDPATAHNDADTQFAQMMVVHHEGAIEMAGLAADRADDDDVRALAERIAEAQQPEIDLMRGWLDSWGEDQPEDTGMSGMEHGGMEMDGLDQEGAMADLEELDGAALDARFLELMTAHHEGAVVMAQAEQEDGENAEAIRLAEAIVEDQTAEIAEMKELLAAL